MGAAETQWLVDGDRGVIERIKNHDYASSPLLFPPKLKQSVAASLREVRNESIFLSQIFSSKHLYGTPVCLNNICCESEITK